MVLAVLTLVGVDDDLVGLRAVGELDGVGTTILVHELILVRNVCYVCVSRLATV